MKAINKTKKRVICAMSGGVDSSVAAALLIEQGYEVIGMFMKLWSEDTEKTDMMRENICCSVDASIAARAVCDKLGIPFYVVNFAKEFKNTVVTDYIREYEAGRTPNPCVICNRDIKGELLFKKMKELDADYLATGHYARIKLSDIRNPLLENSENGKLKTENILHLLQGIDKTKDQTYFLWTLTQQKLKHLLFPVGDYTKSDIRLLAQKYNLPTATRKESQGICFIPDRDVAGFLMRYAKDSTSPGEIVDMEGNKIGMHSGLINYTIGQRERLGLGGPRAYYVIKLDKKTNTLIVGDEADLMRKDLICNHVNWINNPFDETEPELKGVAIGARIRYGHPINDCKVVPQSQKGVYKVTFKKAQRAVTPGQSIVFYRGEEVLGGGVII